MTPENKALALQHAKDEFPRECCGLVIVAKGKERYIPCRNINAQPEIAFTLSPDDYNAASWLGDVVGIVHSHVKLPPTPSEADLAACEATGVRWYITNAETEEWYDFEPTGYEAPLIGRQHVWGTMDCWTVIRDWYKRERGIDLIDIPRAPDFWMRGENPLGDNWKKAGFRRLDEDETLEEGDVLLMQTGNSTVPNHVLLYIGNDEILHHAEGRLSTHEIYGGWYRKHTVIMLRHEDSPSPR